MDSELTGQRRPTGRDAGFSLIELLVATTVLAILTVTATLSLRGGLAQSNDIAAFERSFETHRQLAVQGQGWRGLYIDAQGYRVARYENGAWQSDGGAIRWSRRPALAVQGPRAPFGTPEIVFLPNGATTAFSLRFGPDGSCQSDGWSGLACSE